MDPVKTLGEETPAGAAAAGRMRRPRGLVPEIVAALESDIREGRLVPGQKLPSESELVGRFDVSRTVVREAISRLQASGLVETRHGIGTFVNEPRAVEPTFRIAPEDVATAADVIELLELRISLESEAAALAAQRRSPESLSAMAAALASFHAAIHADSDAVPSDFQFHVEVARATGNRHFAELMTYLGTMIIPRTRLNTAARAPEGRLAYLERVHREHEDILDAIRRQEPEAARAAMRTHLSNSRERLRRAQPET
ncbi:FadR/GntR family transcriptional regulator [Hydrogenophaga flava]|uniref:FadR/GntR family transcriptional regulator n=1 Tax=Hydrogenophaga flava TaxID=65657 RepID=UPI000825E18F